MSAAQQERAAWTSTEVDGLLKVLTLTLFQRAFSSSIADLRKKLRDLGLWARAGMIPAKIATFLKSNVSRQIRQYHVHYTNWIIIRIFKWLKPVNVQHNTKGFRHFEKFLCSFPVAKPQNIPFQRAKRPSKISEAQLATKLTLKNERTKLNALGTFCLSH